MVVSVEKKKLKTWQIVLIVFGVLIALSALFSGFNSEESSSYSTKADKEIVVIEMETEAIFDEFNGLSKIQIDEKINDFKGKRIQTSIYIDKLNEASLSTQYVATEMYDFPYSSSVYAKAFFPSEEKDKLLKASLGSIIIFSGELVTYKKNAIGYVDVDYLEFTKSKVIKIIPPIEY